MFTRNSDVKTTDDLMKSNSISIALLKDIDFII